MNDESRYLEFDYKHPLSWRINISFPLTSLVFTSPVEPMELRSTKCIKVSKHKREKDWLQMFELTNGHTGIFSLFCKDIIDSTRTTDPKDGPNVVSVQYQKWKEMFERTKGRLGREQIQGLLGEILFLKDIMIPKYGEDTAVSSWTGPFGNEQDFQCPDIWYEVKAISSRKNQAKITSLDQLDRDDGGHLVVIMMRSSPGTSSSRLTINSVYRSMIDSLMPIPRMRFMAAMESAGYECLEEYDDYSFKLVNITEYEVMEGFPRLRRSEIDKGISGAVYEINLDEIYNFKVG